MVKTLRRIMMPVLLVFLMSSTAYSFFFGGGPKQKQGASVFGIVIGPSNVNQAGSQYSPIQGATVELRGPKGIINGTTDHMGGFQFQDVPEGEYTLSVNKPGYGSHVEKMSVKNAEIKRVKNIALVPGGGMTTPGGIISPDTVYVAFAKIEENKQSSDTTMWQKAAIMQGADPFALDGNAPPDYSRGMNPYDPGSQVSAHQNTLMTIDPQDVNNLEYVKLDGRPTWLTFNVSGTRLYVATDQNLS